MLGLILTLLAAPQIVETSQVETTEAVIVSAQSPVSLQLPPLLASPSVSGVMCENSQVRQAFNNGQSQGQGEAQQWFSDANGRIYAGSSEPRVRLYSAIALSVGGCSMPIIVMDRVPAADRTIGRIVGNP